MCFPGWQNRGYPAPSAPRAVAAAVVVVPPALRSPAIGYLGPLVAPGQLPAVAPGGFRQGLYIAARVRSRRFGPRRSDGKDPVLRSILDGVAISSSFSVKTASCSASC